MTIMRISSTYNSGYGGAYWGYGQPLRTQSPDDFSSIWDNMPTEDSVTPGVYYAPKGASYVPMDQVMTAPFGANADLLGADDDLGNNFMNPGNSIFQSNNSGFNPFTMASMFSALLSNRNGFGHRNVRHIGRGEHVRGHHGNSNFLSLTHKSGNHSGHNSVHRSDNIFKNNHVNSHGLNIKTSNVRNGSFGKHTTSIHTPSVDFNSREINAGNRNITRTNISGHINSFKQTKQHISGFGTNLDRTRQVIDTPTETITRTRTRGVVWV